MVLGVLMQGVEKATGHWIRRERGIDWVLLFFWTALIPVISLCGLVVILLD